MKALKKGRLFFLILFPVALLLKLIAFYNPSLVEKYYSMGTYKVFSQSISSIIGLIPFAVSELVYYAAVIALAVYLIYTVVSVVSYKDNRLYFILSFITNLLVIFSVLYFIVTVFYGLNLYRKPLNESINLKIAEYSEEDVYFALDDVIKNANRKRAEITSDELTMIFSQDNSDEIEAMAVRSFNKTDTRFKLLDGLYSKPKPFIFPEIMSAFNITGKYSPLFFESTYNQNAPMLIVITSMCENMAAIRGFAGIDDIKFLSYEICKTSDDVRFTYLGYCMALSNLMNFIEINHPQKYDEYLNKLSGDVRKDFIECEEYLEIGNNKNGFHCYSGKYDIIQCRSGKDSGKDFIGLVLSEYAEQRMA